MLIFCIFLCSLTSSKISTPFRKDLSLLGSFGGPILIFIKPKSKYVNLAAVQTMTEDLNVYNLATIAANMYNLNEVFRIMAALFDIKNYEDTDMIYKYV